MHKLFFPLHIKIPAEALAVTASVMLIVTVFRATPQHPAMQIAEKIVTIAEKPQYKAVQDQAVPEKDKSSFDITTGKLEEEKAAVAIESVKIEEPPTVPIQEKEIPITPIETKEEAVKAVQKEELVKTLQKEEPPIQIAKKEEPVVAAGSVTEALTEAAPQKTEIAPIQLALMVKPTAKTEPEIKTASLERTMKTASVSEDSIFQIPRLPRPDLEITVLRITRIVKSLGGTIDSVERDKINKQPISVKLHIPTLRYKQLLQEIKLLGSVEGPSEHDPHIAVEPLPVELRLKASR